MTRPTATATPTNTNPPKATRLTAPEYRPVSPVLQRPTDGRHSVVTTFREFSERSCRPAERQDQPEPGCRHEMATRTLPVPGPSEPTSQSPGGQARPRTTRGWSANFRSIHHHSFVAWTSPAGPAKLAGGSPLRCQRSNEALRLRWRLTGPRMSRRMSNRSGGRSSLPSARTGSLPRVKRCSDASASVCSRWAWHASHRSRVGVGSARRRRLVDRIFIASARAVWSTDRPVV